MVLVCVKKGFFFSNSELLKAISNTKKSFYKIYSNSSDLFNYAGSHEIISGYKHTLDYLSRRTKSLMSA